MAAVDLSAVKAQVTKAVKAQRSGSFARGAECFAAALEAASARAAADCLIVAHLRVHQAYHTFLHSRTPGVPAAEELAAQRTALALLGAAAPALSSRRAAGTLLAGRPRAEDDFAAHYKAEACKGQADTSTLAATGTEIYRDTFLLAADTTLHAQQAFVTNAGGPASLAQPEMSLQLAKARFTFVASALDLIAEPCPLDYVSTAEGLLVATLRYMAQLGPLEAILGTAWERLQRSGALQRRDVAGGLERASRAMNRTESAAKAAVEQRGLRSCALAGCAAREVSVSQFKNCGACKAAAYCCKEHQVAAWPDHKAACKAARKDAASGT
jgi:hypothetical protein